MNVKYLSMKQKTIYKSPDTCTVLSGLFACPVYLLIAIVSYSGIAPIVHKQKLSQRLQNIKIKISRNVFQKEEKKTHLSRCLFMFFSHLLNYLLTPPIDAFYHEIQYTRNIPQMKHRFCITYKTDTYNTLSNSFPCLKGQFSSYIRCPKIAIRRDGKSPDCTATSKFGVSFNKI